MDDTTDRPGTTAERPEVIVDFVFDDGLLFVTVENIGARPARNVRVTFDREFRGSGGRQVVSAMRLFHGIPFLAPRKRITTFLDSSSAYFARREPTEIAVSIEYVDATGAACKDEIRHDLGIYQDIAYAPRAVAREE